MRAIVEAKVGVVISRSAVDDKWRNGAFPARACGHSVGHMKWNLVAIRNLENTAELAHHL